MNKKLSLTGKTFSLSLLGASLMLTGAQVFAQPLTVGGANFSEQSVLANIYAKALEKKGIEVKTRLNLGNREIIIPALKSGEIDIVPEYLGALLNYYDPQAKVTRQQNVEAALKKALPSAFTLLKASSAESTTAWAVRPDTAKKYHLKTLSDLAKVSDQLVVGGPPEVATRALGLPGLARVYGIKFKHFESLDMGGPLSRMALNSKRIDVATVVSTQGNLAKEGWVVLQDDKHEQPSQNVVPLVRKAVLTPQISGVLDEVSAKLNNSALVKLNQQVDIEHNDPATVAGDWVNSNL